VIQLFTQLFELSGATFRIELHDVVANDEHAAALFTIRAELAGVTHLHHFQRPHRR
jgi:hypothetical protein